MQMDAPRPARQRVSRLISFLDTLGIPMRSLPALPLRLMPTALPASVRERREGGAG